MDTPTSHCGKGGAPENNSPPGRASGQPLCARVPEQADGAGTLAVASAFSGGGREGREERRERRKRKEEKKEERERVDRMNRMVGEKA